MSSQSAPKRTISVEAYLTGELRSEVRHEYIDGRAYAMGGRANTTA